MAISVPRQNREINGHLYRVSKGGTWSIKHPELGWVDERVLRHDHRPWRPLELTQPFAAGKPTELPEDETFWANSHYLVHRRELVDDSDPSKIVMVHLSMRTIENDVRHDWREMQRVKNELAGPDWEAVELYPAEARVVDMANQFHLWCYPFQLPIGFPKGIRAEPGNDGTGAVQRPGAGEMPVAAPADLLERARQAGAQV